MNSLKIVHCANFSDAKNGATFYATDRKITNGLTRNGHFVYDFSYRDIAKNSTIFKTKKFGRKKLNDALIETVLQIVPDVLLLGKSELIDSRTLEIIKKELPNIKIAMWWVDWLKDKQAIIEKSIYIDAFFSTTGVEEVKKELNDKSFNNIYFIPNICDKSIDKYSAYTNQNTKYDIMFIGRSDETRKILIDFLLSEFKDYKVGIFGDTKETLLEGQKYLDTLIDTKLAINYSRRNDIELYSSDRLVHTTANGVCTLCPKVPKLDKLFSEDELVYFEDFKELKEKILYYLENGVKRSSIASNGQKKAQTHFNESSVTAYMIEILFNQTFTNDYLWHNL